MLKKNTGKLLGLLEQAIMDIVWKKDETTVRAVVDALGKKRSIAYTTVMTVMTRLAEKGILCRSAQPDGSFLYKPCDSQEEFYAKTSRTIFHQVIKNFGAVAVAQFVDTLEEIDPAQIAALKQRLRKK